MDRKALAEDTLRVIERGKYVAAVSKREIDVRDAIDAAVRGTITYARAMLSVITAPAPNAGAIDASDRAHLHDALVRRAGIVLEIGARHAHTTLVLGAWGCGVFRNDARAVANVFRDHLASRFAAAFERVVFAVWDTTPARTTFETFREVFST